MIFVDGGSRRQRELTYNVASFAWMKLMPRIKKCIINIFVCLKVRIYVWNSWYLSKI